MYAKAIATQENKHPPITPGQSQRESNFQFNDSRTRIVQIDMITNRTQDILNAASHMNRLAAGDL